jgi:thiamine-phosphate pyrophosphorylase
MLLYYITDRKQFAGTERDQRLALLRCVGEAARAGVDYIQLREKDLSIAELERLAREVLQAVRGQSGKTKLLINSRTDVAIAVSADGVHLTSRDTSASEARAIWAASGASQQFHVGVSCHSVVEVRAAQSHGADFVVLGPIFEKADAAPIGLEALRVAARGRICALRLETIGAACRCSRLVE